jgi:long-chain acyl-CoA synthetase
MLRQFGLLNRIQHFAVTRADQACLVYGHDRMTWHELSARVATLAPIIRSRLVGRKARVALQISEPFAFLSAFIGTASAGAAAVPIPERIGPQNLQRLREDCDPGLFITDTDWPPLLAEALALAEADDRARLDDGASTADPDMMILYSSGTTGQPKGVIHTALTRAHAAARMNHEYGMTPNSRTLITAPLYTARALSPIIATLVAGGVAVITDRFEPRQLLQTLREHAPTTLDLVPTQFVMLLDHPDFSPALFRSCEYVLCTGSALDRALADELFRLLPDSFIEGYGSTETDHVSRSKRRAPIDKRGSVGPPAPDIELRVLDEHGRPVAPGGVGELAVASASNLRGYVNEGLTRRQLLDFEGRNFFLTGDLGRLDPDGYLWLAGRAKDMIITGGFNVYATDLESVLRGHPAVADVAVICPSPSVTTSSRTLAPPVLLRCDPLSKC